MWLVQRNFGEEWRTFAAFETFAAANALAKRMHQHAIHPGYRAIETEEIPADLLLGDIAIDPIVALDVLVSIIDATRIARDAHEEMQLASWELGEYLREILPPRAAGSAAGIITGT